MIRCKCRKKVALLTKELKVLKMCCNEALLGLWDRGDNGFIAMIECIDQTMKEVKSI